MKTDKRFHRQGACLVAAGALAGMLMFPWAMHAQERVAKAGYDGAKAIGANESFEILMEGADAPRVAVVLGKLDISSLFERPAPGRLRYSGRGPALPAGEQTVTVYDVDTAGAWTQIGQFPIRLLSPRGFLSTTFQPTADVTGAGQFGAQNKPVQEDRDRDQFQDATTQIGMRTELIRPTVTMKAEGQVAGVTNQNQALRFGSEGERAPRLDLSGYRVDLQRGSTLLSIGHLGIGAQRHLISGFQSRGVAVTVGEGRPVSLQIATLNGSSIVGWSNAFGLENAKHRVWSATVGVEARPRTPGLLRFELGLFQGSSLPLNGFNTGGVVTAETSRGGALRVASNALGGRLRFDGGYTTSRFGEAFDRQVEENLDVTPLETPTAEAHYADLSVDLLQNFKVGAATTASLTLNLHHDFIQPQFRSLGVPLQADLQLRAADVAFSVGEVTGTLASRRTRDNLGNLDSLLTTRTATDGLSVSMPLATMLGEGATQSSWYPTISVQAQLLHQFADVVPTDAFPIDSLPDQLSRNVAFAADWQISAWRIGGRLGRTTQDDRRSSSGIGDLETDTGALTFDWAPRPRFSFGGDVGLDRSRSEEQQKTDSVFRWAARTNWTVYKEVTLVGSITNIRGFDDLDQRDSDNLDSSLELSTGFRLSRADRRKGRVFVRWVDRRGDLLDRTFGLRDVRRNSAFATGITVSMF